MGDSQDGENTWNRGGGRKEINRDRDRDRDGMYPEFFRVHDFCYIMPYFGIHTVNSLSA
jgi:hypothetical protein